MQVMALNPIPRIADSVETEKPNASLTRGDDQHHRPRGHGLLPPGRLPGASD